MALTAATSAHAGGFQLNERSSKALGTSLAGAASAATDASFAAFNPAAISTVENVEVVTMTSLVAPIAEGTVESTGQEVDADQAAIVPGFAAGWRTHEDFAVGVVVYSPFGLITDYESDFVGAAEAETSELKTISTSPTMAWNITPGLAVGASLNILYSDARLTNSFVDLEGDSTDISFSFGGLARPFDGTQIGIAYHQGYDLELRGTNKINVIPGSPVFGTAATASLPDYVLFGVTQEVTDDIRVMAEGKWVGWSDFDQIDISTPDAPFPFTSLSEFQNYENSWFATLGAEWDATDRITLRGGVAWDQTPTTDEDRTPRVPDEDRVWLSLGGSYNVADWLTVDASYSYLHALDDATVELEQSLLAPSPDLPTTVEYDGGAHIVSVGGAIRF